MKKFICGMICFLMVLPFANAKTITHDPDVPMRSKSFSKTFSMDARDQLNLNNRFGEILIKTWDKREVRVDVDIKVYSKDERDAEHIANEITIDASKKEEQISFKTIFGAMQGQYGNKVKDGKTIWRREMKVNYVVYMPASNALTIVNQYGNVNMGSFSGALNAKVQYGNFTAENLTSDDNYLNMQYGKITVQEVNKAVIKHQYGSGLTLNTINTLELDAQYVSVNIGTVKGDALIKQQYGQGLNIGSVDNLDLKAQYINVRIGTVTGDANVKQQYNNISIGSVNKLIVKGQYTKVNIAALKGDGDFDIQYDKLTIDHIGTGCKVLTIGVAYSGVSLGFSNNYHADFDVNMNYSEFKYGSRATGKLVSENGSNKKYSGKIGNGGAAKINIKTNYGSVNFN